MEIFDKLWNLAQLLILLFRDRLYSRGCCIQMQREWYNVKDSSQYGSNHSCSWDSRNCGYNLSRLTDLRVANLLWSNDFRWIILFSKLLVDKYITKWQELWKIRAMLIQVGTQGLWVQNYRLNFFEIQWLKNRRIWCKLGLEVVASYMTSPNPIITEE